ncbi:hypothetical protein VMHJH2_07185 [Streptococcus uberis]|uniref:hypothetical protein n=1 Tax=Streptococcus uberis TaxID=1349 RepID=UPI00214FA6A1|nr:hypothetical protein [Streptococcus uberis]MCR4258298.1 hypothetical protein [Streptococcus uberis]
MEQPTFDFYLLHSYEIQDGQQQYEIISDSKLIYEFLNSNPDVYFQRFYCFEDNFVVLEERIDNKVIVKSNREIIVDENFNISFK